MKENMNIFEYAVRNKVRFPFRGLVSVEDLWDLSVEQLDQIFKTLNTQRKQSQEESLLDTRCEDEELVVQIELVKHIVSVKLAEQEAREEAAEKKAKKQKILGIMARKQDEALENTSMEDLQKLLDELDG